MNADTRDVRVRVDGRWLQVPAGTTVAAACARAAAPGEDGATRRSPSGGRRHAVCGMGVCGECRVGIDGQAHRCGCQVACHDGQSIERALQARGPARDAWPSTAVGAQDARVHEASVVVVGAGPAGLAAAEAASSAGLDVVLLDAAPSPGGNGWRATQDRAVDEVARRLARLQAAGVSTWTGARVVAVLPDRTLLVERGGRAGRLRGRRLVLATGARERLLPVPGGTRPGVFGAGGLQALAKGGWPVAGRRVLVAGTGPLLLAAAASLRALGARVVELAEEAPAGRVAAFATGLVAHPARLRDAIALGASLAGLPYRAGWRVMEALPAAGAHPADAPLARVRLAHADGRERLVDCDLLAAGWGLVPQLELARACGVATGWRDGVEVAVVDARQRSRVPEVLVAGEGTGVAGIDAALASGAIAGRTVARDLAPDRAPPPHADAPDRHRLDRARRFAARVARAFPPPADLAARWRDDTVVCRCEDVDWSTLRAALREAEGAADPLHAAKLATRAGMGHCQGRGCHHALACAGAVRVAAALPGDPPTRPQRPPIGPMPLAHLLAIPSSPDDDGGTP